MAHFFCPGSMGSTSPDLAMLDAMISDPASPKPSASSYPILIMAFSMSIVSRLSPYACLNYCSTATSGFLAILLTF